MATKPKKPPRTFAPLPCGAVLLALDVSSSVTGWAVGRIRDGEIPEILDFGVVKPPSGRTSVERTDLMSIRIAYLVKVHDPVEICMEFQGHCNSGKRVQGLAVLGQAQGSIRTYLAMTHRVVTIGERDWTKLNGKNCKKEARCENVKKLVPAYARRVEENPKYDRGMDAADAIGLAIWRAFQ